jgi:hypothetical protein
VKTTPPPYVVALLLVLLGFASPASSQGRVVINEYMPWTLNGCGATAEFVELMNFGPGPIDISCYIITDGDYAITIPATTILQPGEYYVIAGRSVINHPCANIDSTIHVDLNWNSCGCTSGPIPTTGDGLFTDGGSANEQVVLLDPNLNVVDAVVRNYPVEPSSLITTAFMDECPSKQFDLDLMNIRYETLGMSTGRGNSFARRLDGDCGWVKDPQQSGNATNNTPGELSDVSYQLTVVTAMDCDSNHGSIDVYVDIDSYDNVFPMNYTIAFDADRNGIFDFADTYTYGVDSTPPSIAIMGLPLGRYRLVVASVNGCYLRTFEFNILECIAVLPSGLVYFKLKEKNSRQSVFEWLISETETLQSVQLEKSGDGVNYTSFSPVPTQGLTGARMFTQAVPADEKASFYRLRMTDKSGKPTFSPVLRTNRTLKAEAIWPNPAGDLVQVSLWSKGAGKVAYSVHDASGATVLSGAASLIAGDNRLSLPVQKLARGVYQVVVKDVQGQEQPISLRFVKH